MFLPDTASRGGSSNPWGLPVPAANLYNRLQYAGQFWIGVAAWPAVWQYINYDEHQDAGPIFGTFERTPGEDELNCPTGGTQVFAPWQDYANYMLAPNGGLESGTTGWSVSGGTSVVYGNQPFFRSGTHALSLPSGSSALSPVVCLGKDQLFLRMFGKDVGGADRGLRVRVVWYGLLNSVLGISDFATFAPGQSWAPTGKVSSSGGGLAVPLLPIVNEALPAALVTARKPPLTRSWLFVPCIASPTETNGARAAAPLVSTSVLLVPPSPIRNPELIRVEPLPVTTMRLLRELVRSPTMFVPVEVTNEPFVMSSVGDSPPQPTRISPILVTREPGPVTITEQFVERNCSEKPSPMAISLLRTIAPFVTTT